VDGLAATKLRNFTSPCIPTFALVSEDTNEYESLSQSVALSRRIWEL
jgi:hypothetical protein